MEGVKKRNRDESAPAVKKLRYDILDTLDGVEVDVDPEVSELTSLMKSFQEEIELAVEGEKSAEVMDQDLSPSEIRWLLEASDDELGLPPSGDMKELLPLPCFEPAAEDCLGFEAWGFCCGGDDGGHEREECLGFDDLFGYEDVVSHFGGFS